MAWCCRFFKQAPDTSILAENVSFVDHIGPRIGLRASAVEGKKAYSQHMWLLRFHSSLFFSRCEVPSPPVCLLAQALHTSQQELHVIILKAPESKCTLLCLNLLPRP